MDLDDGRTGSTRTPPTSPASTTPASICTTSRTTSRSSPPSPAGWLAGRSEELDAGNIKAIITAAGRSPLTGVKASELDTKVGYFKHNAHRMRYAHFRKLGMFIGSGAIEGGIKAIVAQRTKQSGMHWTTAGAASIIALRTQHASGRWDELWTAHPATPARLQAAI